jgi:putative ABC transport system permease protein
MHEALKQSIENLRTNKLRSFLTMFGIMWGVISIVMLSAMGEGFQRGNQAVIEELGKNIVIIRNGRTSTQVGGERAGRVVRLTIADAYALKSSSRVIQEVSPELMRGGVSVKSA